MLRLTEVASQSVTFVKPALRKAKTNTVNSLNEWMAQPATTPQCFLLTGRLYRLLDAAPVEYVFQPSQLKYKVISEMLSMRPWHIIFTQRFLLVTR